MDCHDRKVTITHSRDFARWLSSTGHSLAFTTYQAGKLFLLGVNSNGFLSVTERTFARSMGLGISRDGHRLVLATEFQIQTFDNLLPSGSVSTDGLDALFAPHAGWVTGDLDAHDVGFGLDGRPLFINTLFSCIATVSDDHSFRAVWTPPFISRLAAEDRCHLNGMAIDGGSPRFVTAVSRSDSADGWRDKRADGGVVLEVATGEVVSSGLCMPHSPRLHDGRLWLLNSGVGEFGFVDLSSGRFEQVAFCPGYARGLAFVEGHAIVGLSLPRDNRTFAGLPLDDALLSRNTDARCGLAVFSLNSGDMVGWLRVEGLVSELYDVATVPGVRRPGLVGFKSDEVKRLISIDDRPSN